MTLLIVGYKSKKELRASVGKHLKHREMGFDRFYPDGRNVVAHRPAISGCPGKEFYATVVCKNGLIEEVL